MELAQVGRWLLVFGLGAVVTGGLLLGLSFVAPGLKLGRLSGDLVFGQGGAKVFIPITTMILASLFLTGVIWLVGVLRK